MILHLCSALVRHLAAVSRTRRMQTYWRESSKVQWRGWSIWHSQKGWKSCLLWITEGSGGSHQHVQIHEGMVWRVRLFLLMCIERARDKSKHGIYNSKRIKNSFLLWVWSNMGTPCPEGCGGLHPWQYTKPDQTQPWATCSCWPSMCKDMEIPESKPNGVFAVY